MAEEEKDETRLRLGGMALRNGLLVHGPTSWALAVRNSKGEIEVASGAKPRLARGRLSQLPILRGPLRLAEGLLVVPLARLRLRSARLPLEDPRVIGAAAMASVASAAARKLARGSASREALVAAIGLLPAVAALRDRDLAAYHGAEHKAIGAYESGGSAADEPKEHERCGSNLIGPLLAFSVAGQVIVEGVFDAPQLDRPRRGFAGGHRRRCRGLRFRRAQAGCGALASRPRSRLRDPAAALDPGAFARATRRRRSRARGVATD